MFREAAERLKKTESSNKLPNAGKLSAEIRELEEQKGRLIEDNRTVGKKLKEYETVKYNLEKITDKDRENSFETQPEIQIRRYSIKAKYRPLSKGDGILLVIIKIRQWRMISGKRDIISSLHIQIHFYLYLLR